MRFLLALSLLFCFVFLGVHATKSHSSSKVSPLFSAVPDYRDYTFERFESEYGKKYHSTLSRENHKRIFYDNLHRINHHNAQLGVNGKTYYMKINKYADLSPETIVKKFTGRSKALASKKHALKNMIEYQSPAQAFNNDIPAAVDWRNEGAVTPVKDQGGCGSCWAHTAIESIESAYVLNTHSSQIILSPQHMLECTPNPKHCGGTGGCEGATAELGFEWAKSGVAAESTVPYQGADAACPTTVEKAVKVGGWVKLPENNATALLEAVAFVGPISISVDASAWSFYGGGVFNGCDKTNPDINHGVQLVGYGHDASVNQDYWLVRNSWGSSWGESGYIRLYRDGTNNPDPSTCPKDTKPQDGTACAGETAPVTVCGTCGILYDTSYPTDVTKY